MQVALCLLVFGPEVANVTGATMAFGVPQWKLSIPLEPGPLDSPNLNVGNGERSIHPGLLQ